MHTKLLKPLLTPVVASVDVPGSKSYTNRALLISAMIQNSVTVHKPLFSDDTRAMTQCLQDLGIGVKVSADAIDVTGDISQVQDKEYNLNCILSGTTIRFMLALCAIIPGTQTLFGDTGLNERPIADIVDALVSLGAHIEYLNQTGFPPIRITSNQLHSEPVVIKGSSSSQYVSALLMIAPLLQGLSIATEGEVISKPYIDMTLATMEQFGVRVKRDSYKLFKIPSQSYTGKSYTVEGDISSASYFFAIAALTKSTITVRNTNPQSIQADMGFLRILANQGNIVTYNENAITVKGIGAKPIQVDMEHCPDQAATMAVLSSFADGNSTLTGVQSLRIKETERVIALETELAKMGVNTHSTNSTITIHGGKPKPANINTYNDHRMAMTFAVAGTKLSGISINNPEVVTKTFPSFWEQYESLNNQHQTQIKNIVLIGMRGSGKTTTAISLGKLLDRKVIDIDAMIVQKQHKKIADIITEFGWPYFRNLERAAVGDLANIENAIISTGGGAVLDEQNIKILKNNGVLFWLQAKPETLIQRIGATRTRPALTDQQTVDAEITEVARERNHLYRDAADYTIVTDEINFEQVANTINEIYRRIAQ